MKLEDFDLFVTLVRQRSGLILTPEKGYLLESRLLPVARKHNLKNLEDMASVLRGKRDESLMFDITEAMTTNETYFLRDYRIFKHFQKVILPRFIETRSDKRHLRLWAAGTSSGQEAYSLAMACAEEAGRLQGWKIEIVGTDLSRDMITRAKSGIYSQFEVQRGLPIKLLVKYFHQIVGDKWQIADPIRQMVQFREANLLSDFSQTGPFDIALCRNVVSYFDAPTKTRVLQAIASVMPSDGILWMGSGESLTGVSDRFALAKGEKDFYAPAALATPPHNVFAAAR